MAERESLGQAGKEPPWVCTPSQAIRFGRAITRSRPGRVAGSQYTESLDVHLEGGRVGEIDVTSP